LQKALLQRGGPGQWGAAQHGEKTTGAVIKRAAALLLGGFGPTPTGRRDQGGSRNECRLPGFPGAGTRPLKLSAPSSRLLWSTWPGGRSRLSRGVRGSPRCRPSRFAGSRCSDSGIGSLRTGIRPVKLPAFQSRLLWSKLSAFPGGVAGAPPAEGEAENGREPSPGGRSGGETSPAGSERAPGAPTILGSQKSHDPVRHAPCEVAGFPADSCE
jgi:hypothetical protein